MHSVSMGNGILSAHKVNTPLFLIIQYFKIIFSRLLKTYFYLDTLKKNPQLKSLLIFSFKTKVNFMVLGEHFFPK